MAKDPKIIDDKELFQILWNRIRPDDTGATSKTLFNSRDGVTVMYWVHGDERIIALPFSWREAVFTAFQLRTHAFVELAQISGDSDRAFELISKYESELLSRAASVYAGEKDGEDDGE